MVGYRWRADLTVKGSSPLTWSAQSQVYVGRNQQALHYDSWLLTMDGQPLRVDVSKTRVPADPHVPKQEQLEVTIFPKRCLARGLNRRSAFRTRPSMGPLPKWPLPIWWAPRQTNR